MIAQIIFTCKEAISSFESITSGSFEKHEKTKDPFRRFIKKSIS
jgi:hypothetical protein